MRYISCTACGSTQTDTAGNLVHASNCEGFKNGGGGAAFERGRGAAEFDPVNRPKHYNSHPSGIQPIEITRHMGFNLGNAMKYIWRADEKGAPIEDLRKAIWYIQDEIKKRGGTL